MRALNLASLALCTTLILSTHAYTNRNEYSLVTNSSDSTPEIILRSGGPESPFKFTDDSGVNYVIAYGMLSSVSCVATDADKLTLKKDGELLVTDKESDTSISVSFNEILPLQKTIYTCTDGNTGLEQTVAVIITPLIRSEVSWFPVRKEKLHMVIEWTNAVLTCSGPLGSKLVVTKNGREVQTEPWRDQMLDEQLFRTVKWVVGEDDIRVDSIFVCTDTVTGYSRSVSLSPRTNAVVN